MTSELLKKLTATEIANMLREPLTWEEALISLANFASVPAIDIRTVREVRFNVVSIIRSQLPEKLLQGLGIQIQADPYFLKCWVKFERSGYEPYKTSVVPPEFKLSDEAIAYVCAFLG